MRRIIVVLACLLFGTTALWAQKQEFKAFADKYADLEEFTVAEIDKATLRAASALADSDTRKMMRAVDLMIIVDYTGEENVAFREDAYALAEQLGYQMIREEFSEQGYMQGFSNEAMKVFVIYSQMPNSQIVTLLIGNKNFNENMFNSPK